MAELTEAESSPFDSKMRAAPSIKEFFLAVWAEWASIVGGGLIFIASLFAILDLWSQRTLWEVVAIGALLTTSYKVWEKERRSTVSLEEWRRPKLKCSFSESDPGCIRPNTSLTGVMNLASGHKQNVKLNATYYRIKVETNHSHRADGCYGRLISVRFYDEPILQGENIELPFAHSEEDAFAKSVHEGAPEYLDLLAIVDDEPVIATKGFKKPSSITNHLFSRPGSNVFDVVILTSQGTSVKIKPVLSWTGNRLSSKMTA